MQIIEGDAYRHAADTGSTVILSDGTTTLEETAADNVAEFSRLPLGRWWIVERSEGVSKRAGTVDVVPVADPVETKLIGEIRKLDESLDDLEKVIEHQTSNQLTGVTHTRSQISTLRRQRANAECRLQDYRRRQRGESPWR